MALVPIGLKSPNQMAIFTWPGVNCSVQRGGADPLIYIVAPFKDEA